MRATLAVGGSPSPERRFPDRRENRPPQRERRALLRVRRSGIVGGIDTHLVSGFFRRHSASCAVAGLLITAVGVVLAVIGLVTVPDVVPGDPRDGALMSLTTIVPFGLAGALLLGRRPDLPFGWLLSGATAALVVQLATVDPAVLAVRHGHYTGPARWGLAMSGLGFVPIAVEGLINVRFPSGRTVGRWGRRLERVLVIGLVATVLSDVFDSNASQQYLPAGAPASFARPLAGYRVGRIADLGSLFAPVVVLLGLIAGIGVVVRCRRAMGLERQQLKWRAAGVVVSFALFPLVVTDHSGPVLDDVGSAVFVATLVIPVLRHGLWSIDTIIRRSAVYGGVTAVLVAGYVLVTALGAGLVSQRTAASVGAAGAAVAFAPVRTLSQRTVDRLFYGLRSDPYRALSDLGARLDAVATPGQMLPAVVSAVSASLRLPYVAIERPGDHSVLAASGEPPATAVGLERWGLSYQGSPVGSLVAAPRRGETTFDDRDRAVLADIARQAGAAVHAEALTADLLVSRQRLVTAREEERRRLRRDLHDGLGPMLTGLGLNLDAARSRLAAAATQGRAPGPGSAHLARAEEFLVHAKEASAQVITDLRGMVYDLRPPALDDLGLAGAVQVHAERVAAGSPLEIEIDAAGLSELPAAVEVAAFRTAVEAITNVVRHSGARRCRVHLAERRPEQRTDGELVLEVTDDGGTDGSWRPGVGLTAMRERAEELGGTFTAGYSPTGGRVLACYPLPADRSGAGVAASR